MSDKPCPNCGHCPTCGRSNYPRVGRWPTYPYYGPYWSVIPPYRTGDFPGGYGTVTVTSGDTVAVNN